MVVHDVLDVASILRACSFPVRHVAADDPHTRHDVLASNTEGTTMGIIIGLKGPHAAAHVDTSNSRNPQRKALGRREHDTRLVEAEHSFLLKMSRICPPCQSREAGFA